MNLKACSPELLAPFVKAVESVRLLPFQGCAARRGMDNKVRGVGQLIPGPEEAWRAISRWRV